MDINQVIQYCTAAGVIYALYEALYKHARWRTTADIKLNSINVAWKPQINAILQEHGERLNSIDTALVEQNKEILQELRTLNQNVVTMDKNLAMAILERQHLEERFERHEQDHAREGRQDG